MRRIFKFIWRLVLGQILFSVFMVFLYKWIPVPATPLMVIRAYEQNHKVQMYFGGYYSLRKEYKKALSYYEQARKTANQFVEERLAELKIKQTLELLDPNP